MSELRSLRDTLLGPPPPKPVARVAAGLTKTRALVVVSTWIESSDDYLVLQGGTGCGKTLAACWLFAFFRHRPMLSESGREFRALWISAKELACIPPWDAGAWSVFDAAPAVFIDDVGTEHDAGRMTSALERIADLARGRCVITTNLSAEDFLARYGARLVSRLRAGRWETIGDPDYRGDEPTGAKWPDPTTPTKRERELQRKAELEEKRWAETTPEREALARAALAEVSALGNAKVLRMPTRDEALSDEDRRALLQRQLDERRGRR